MNSSYDKFKSMLQKIANTINFILKYKVWFIIALIFILATTGVLTGISGKILTAEMTSKEITYGENIKINADAIFTSPKYQYAVKGSDTWKSGLPIEVGEYNIRVVSNRAFGIKEYSDNKNLTINKKPIDIVVTNKSYKRGDEIKLGAKLVESNKIICEQFEFVINDNSITISPNLESIKIVDGKNYDLTHCYDIQSVEPKTVPIEKRVVSIRFLDIEREYGELFKNDEYRFVSGDNYVYTEESNLAPGDRIEVVSVQYGMLLGEFTVQREFAILDANGENVDSYYEKHAYGGKVTIHRKNIIVSTYSGEKYYDGLPLQDQRFKEEIVLPNGDQFTYTFPSITNVGSIENKPIITPSSTTNLDNYNIIYETGTLVVKLRPLKIQTKDFTKTYDGLSIDNIECVVLSSTTTAHSTDANTLSLGLLSGDRIVFEPPIQIVNPGVYAIQKEWIKVKSQSDEVRNYYDITLNGDSFINIKKVLVKVVTHSKEKVFDKTPLQCLDYTITRLDELEGLPTDWYQLTITGKITFVGNTYNTFTFNSKYVEVREQELGTLTITPIALTININGRSKPYDNTPITPTIYAVGLLSEDSVRTTQSLTEVGRVNLDYDLIEIDYWRPDLTEANLYYDVTINHGDINYLEVKRANITIISNDNQKTYDGQPLYPILESNYEQINGLVNISITNLLNDEIYINATPAGGVQTRITGVSIFVDQRDRTNCFNITYSETNATLNIFKRNITVHVEDKTILFDNEYHNGSEMLIEVVSGELVGGENIEIIPSDNSIIEPDSSLHVNYGAKITKSDSSNSTDNYNISKQTSVHPILNIKKRAVTITTIGATKQYDGTPLVCHEYDLTGDPLLVGDSVNITFSGSQTELGKSFNTVSMLSIGSDTIPYEYYDISLEEIGELIVQKDITIITLSARKYGDGNPLAFPFYNKPNVLEQLIPGHRINVNMTSTLHATGSVLNDCVVTIYNESNHDITDLYNISYEKGYLEILQQNSTMTPLFAIPHGSDMNNPYTNSACNTYGIETESYTGSAPGASGSLATIPNTWDGETITEIITNQSGVVYLKEYTYGDYYANRLLTVAPYNNLYNGDKFSYASLFGFVPSSQMSLNNSGKHGVLPQYGNLDNSITSDVDYYQARGETYNINYIYAQDYKIDQLVEIAYMPGELSSKQEVYYDYVTNNYLNITSSDKNRIKNILNAYQINTSSYQEIADFIKYRMPLHENLIDGAMLDTELDIIGGFNRYKTLSPIQYAYMGMLTYRAVSIPSRVVCGYKVNTIANVKKDVSFIDRYYWVEIYVENVGWLMADVALSEPLIEINISAKNITKEHTGDVIYHTNEIVVEGNVLQNLLNEGYSYQATVSGSGVDVGEYVATISSFAIFKDGVDVTYKFYITKKDGVLNIVPKILNLRLANVTKEYDGTALVLEQDDYYIPNNTEKLRVQITKNISIIEPHNMTIEELNQLIVNSYRVFNLMNEEVTDEYLVQFEDGGKFEVTKRNIEITTATYIFAGEYNPDGNSFWISKGELVGLDTINIEFQPQPPGATSWINSVASCVIYSSTRDDVTYCYNITYVEGTITKEEESFEE